MFCPLCKSEFREGFNRCSDCHVDLVPERPPTDESSASPDRERNPRLFLAWFLPMALFYLLTLILMFVPGAARQPLVKVLAFIIILTQDFGGLWMIFHSIRYERRPGKYCLLAFVPFTFVWYYLARVRTGRGASALPSATRSRTEPGE